MRSSFRGRERSERSPESITTSFAVAPRRVTCCAAWDYGFRARRRRGGFQTRPYLRRPRNDTSPIGEKRMIQTVAGVIGACEGPALVHEHLRIDLTHRLAAIVIGAEDEADVVADLRQAAAAHGLRLVA